MFSLRVSFGLGVLGGLLHYVNEFTGFLGFDFVICLWVFDAVLVLFSVYFVVSVFSFYFGCFVSVLGVCFHFVVLIALVFLGCCTWCFWVLCICLRFGAFRILVRFLVFWLLFVYLV